jgi:CRISPR-associated endonuclease/helicase Cas3
MMNISMLESFPQFFGRVTGREILPYQLRYGADPFSNTLLIIPTGLGKTHAVLVPWLYAVANRVPGTPRRLVYILPRRALTTQTAAEARKLKEKAGIGELPIFELMGSSTDNRATIAPDQYAIICGTQDLIVSRALNRGYARRPPRWPIDFALLNNDCLWIVDEIQLAADSLATSTQLAAFRERLKTIGPVPCVWMSATANPDWLCTVDFPVAPKIIRLDESDRSREVVQRRIHAVKKIARAPEECRTPVGCAAFAAEQHAGGSRTLIIVNTVQRARDVFAELKKLGREPLLLHSRFRRADRDQQTARLKDDGIVVATQVLEAGVDITARRLITDVAPWGSMVQRFGRVNRYGEDNEAQIWWVDRPVTSKRKSWATSVEPGAKELEEIFRPYAPEDIAGAQTRLAALASAAPADLPDEDGPEPWQNVLRYADLIDLFDTSSDISGNELDVSRFIRTGDDKDRYLAWRVWKEPAELAKLPDIEDDELCPVSIGDVKAFAKKDHELLYWDFSADSWRAVDPNRLWPGMTILVPSSAGGYTADEGWNPESRKAVPPVGRGADGPEGDSDDPLSWVTYRQTLREHTSMVVDELTSLVESLSNLDIGEFTDDLRTAAVKHDWGKTHEVMQETLHGHPPEFLAKQKRSEAERAHRRKHFRHELASALAMIASGDSDLSAYVVAAHHGRVRMGIRSMPGERQNGKAIARGIQEGDRLPACDILPGIALDELTLSLDIMTTGRANGKASWTERALGVRDRLGPFRLAFLEMLLRAADVRASDKRAKQESSACTA